MNKKIKKTLAAVLAIFAMLNIAGCSERRTETNPTDDPGTSDPVISDADAPNDSKSGSDTSKESGVPDTSEDSGAESSDSSSDIKWTSSDCKAGDPYPSIELTDSNAVNSIRLLDALIANSDEEQKNAMFSPLSLNMALGLLESGANGETKAAFDKYLCSENYSDIAEHYLEFAKENRTREEKIDPDWGNTPAAALEIANSFWADHTLQLNTDYKQTVSDKFDAEIQSVDFADKEKTLGKINGWVNDKTHEMIPTILSDYDENSTLAVLINTVYFESTWTDKWSVDENKKESFTLADGTVKELPLMYNGGDEYFENDHATAFSCGYRGGMEFIGILPKQEGDFTLESLDIPSLLESRSYDYDVSAVMPRFEFDSAFALKDALAAAGLGEMFDTGADLSGISEYELFVSEILQKTRIELDEHGTRASAATAAILFGTAMPPTEKRTVRLDRPFAFMIYDQAEDQILFVGKVTNP